MIKKISVFVGLACLFVQGIAGVVDAEISVDLSSPESAFQSLQTAFAEQDATAMERVLANTVRMDNLQKFVQEILNTPDSWFFTDQWRILNVEYVTEFSHRYPRARVWMELRDMKINETYQLEYMRGYHTFQKEEDQWKWLSMASGFNMKEYDFSTPTKAYRSIGGAMFSSNLRRQSDILAIYGAIASHLKEGVTFEEYQTLIKRRRKSKFQQFPPYFHQDKLEEEMLPTEIGEDKAKVWSVTREGRRASFELFIKEGSEWKWLPRSEYIWYPSKVKDDK